MPDPYATHEVTNQVPPLVGVNLYRMDRTLKEAIGRFGGGWGDAALHRYGALRNVAAFVATRLGPRSLTYGALTDTTAVAELLERIELPEFDTR